MGSLLLCAALTSPPAPGRVRLEGAVDDRQDDRSDHADEVDRQHGPGYPGPALAHGATSPPRGAAAAPRLVGVLLQHRPESVTNYMTPPRSAAGCQPPAPTLLRGMTLVASREIR